MAERKGPKKIIVDVPDELHTEIKVRSAQRNITMKIFVLQALFDRIEQERLYETKQN